MEERLRQLEEPLDILKRQIDQASQQVKLRPLKKDDKNDALISSFGGGVKLSGYPIEKVSVPPSTDPKLSVQAAYNLWAILDYASKKAKEGGIRNYADLGKNDKKEIKKALMNAIDLLTPESGIVVDGVTAKLAKAYAEFFQKVVLQSEGIYPILPDFFKGIIKFAIRNKLEKKFPNEKISEERVEEKIKETMGLAPKSVQMIGKFFEIAGHRYHIRELSKEIETLGQSSELPTQQKQSELRQSLLDFLPDNLHSDMPQDLNEAFFAEYRIRCVNYLYTIKQINTNELRGIKNLLKTTNRFNKERDEFDSEFSTFFEKTLSKLADKVAPKQQLASEIEVPPAPLMKKEVDQPFEVPIEPVTEEKPGEEGYSPTKPEEFEEKIEIASPPTTSTEELTSELISEDEKFPVSLEEFNKIIAKQENKIEELDAKLVTLSNEIIDFDKQSKNLDIKKKELSVQIDSLKKWSKEEEQAAWTERQVQRENLKAQRDSVKKLREDIDNNRLALDPVNQKEKLAWLGLENGKSLEDYLDAQKQENNVLEKVFSTASNWWDSLVSEKIKPPIDYQVEKVKLLGNLEETDKRLIAGQTELDKKEQALSQQVKDDQQEFIQLNTQLTSLENEIQDLGIKIKEKNTEKTQVEENKKQAGKQKKALEAGKEKLLEQEKLVEKEKQKLEAVKQLEENVKESREKPQEEIAAPASDEAVVLFATSEIVDPVAQENNEAGERAAAKERYETIKQQYMDAKGFSNVVSALVELIKAFFEYQGVKNKLKDTKNDLADGTKQENTRKQYRTAFFSPVEDKKLSKQQVEQKPAVSPDDNTPPASRSSLQ